MQVLNELPTDIRHIKVPTTRKNSFPKIFFQSVLHNQTSVESL